MGEKHQFFQPKCILKKFARFRAIGGSYTQLRKFLFCLLTKKVEKYDKDVERNEAKRSLKKLVPLSQNVYRSEAKNIPDIPDILEYSGTFCSGIFRIFRHRNIFPLLSVKGT